MEKSPLAMLAKACETIGYNATSEPSPKKPKTANGTPKAANQQNAKHINGVNHVNYNAELNGKTGDGANANSIVGKQHVKKDTNGVQQNRKGSPRANGVSNAVISCEPSTSSPLTSVANGQMPPPFMTANPAMFMNPNFPAGILQRFQAPNGLPGAAPNGQPQAPFHGMPPMPMPPGFPGGAPFNLAAMAAMAAAFGGAQPGMPNPGAMAMQGMPIPGAMRPPNPPTTSVANQGHNPAVSQAMSSTPPATTPNTSHKRSVHSTPTSSGIQNGHFPTPIPNPMQGPEAEAVFAAMAAHQQMAAMFPYGFPPMFGMPPMMAPGAMVPPQTQVSLPVDNGAAANQAAQASANSLQSILMATACGQQPRFTCTYGMQNKNGQTCGKSFDTDLELFAHYRQHLQAGFMQTAANGTPAVSSPSQTVSSTTTEPTVSTASSAPPSTNAASAMAGTPQHNGGGKIKSGTASLKHSPVSSAPSPKHQQIQQQTVLPNNGMLWSPMPNALQCPPPVSTATPQHANNRFHPYAAMPKPMPQGGPPPAMTPQQQQMMQHMQYEFAAMAAAAAASGLPMPGMPMPYGPLMGPPPHMMHHPGAIVNAHQAQAQIPATGVEKGN